ncbi:MAG: tRNA preQ1(34) S-adenosylmethionine ribosyltransferase-isomerase QueA [Pseudomonadota bacterium]
MDIEDFDFDLPEALIALRPAAPRRSARMLVSRSSGLVDAVVERLPEMLAPGDLLVFNNTKVIPARLFGVRKRESPHGDGIARIETLLTERLDAARWRVLARPAKRLAIGDLITFGDPSAFGDLNAEVMDKARESGAVTLRFSASGPALDEAIARIGQPPLPPYIASKRETDARDAVDYQTIFAKREGAVAAPTAALHFDAPLLAAMEARGLRRIEVTLHVGAGTFLPPRPEDVAAGRLHQERGALDASAAAAIAAAKAAGGRVIAVGTTAARVLETAALAGAGVVRPWEGATDLFIAPGFRFRAVDVLMTNFHLPRSTLIMLVAAFIGRSRTQAAYAHAIERGYRFYSYGDASLLFPGND